MGPQEELRQRLSAGGEKYFRLNKYIYIIYLDSAGGDGAPVRLGDHGRAVRVRQPHAGHQEQRRDPQAVGRQVGEQPSTETRLEF